MARSLAPLLALALLLLAAGRPRENQHRDEPEWAGFCGDRRTILCQVDNDLARRCLGTCCGDRERRGEIAPCDEPRDASRAGLPLQGLRSGGGVADDVDKRWILVFEADAPGPSERDMDHLVEEAGVSVVYRGGGSGGGPILVLSGTDSAMRALLANEVFAGSRAVLETDREISLVEHEPDRQASRSSEEEFPWGLDRIDDREGLDASYEPLPGQDGSGVNVYILDTGVRTTHEEFGGRALPAIDVATTGSLVECDPGDASCASDIRGHGTHVAGIIGGQTYGVAKQSTLHAAKCLNDVGQGYISWLVESIDWVASNAFQPAVACMSLAVAGTTSSILQAASRAMASNINLVVASGNHASDACFYSPGNVAGVLNVAASDQLDARPVFSNYGSCVDIFAPGVAIPSANAAADTGSVKRSGTSMANPHVAGALALIRGESPGLTAQEAHELVLAAATRGLMPVGDEGSPDMLLYTGLASDSYTTTRTTATSTISTSTTLSTTTSSPAWEWRSLGSGYCRDESCISPSSCSNTFGYTGSCVSFAECTALCESTYDCVSIAWSESPADNSNSCNTQGKSRCVVYTSDSGHVASRTSYTSQEYQCYHQEVICSGPEREGTHLHNKYPCMCGSATCSFNEMCDEEPSLCKPAFCSTVDGSGGSDTYPCSCGASICTINEICDAATSTCTVPECSVTDGTAPSEAYPCACEGDKCSVYEICDVDSCILVLITAGTCQHPVTNMEDCSQLAEWLLLQDVTAADDGQEGVGYDPPFCYFEGGSLKFNVGGTNTGVCTSVDKCLCYGITTTTTTLTTATSVTSTRTSTTRTSTTRTTTTGTTTTATTLTATTLSTTATSATATTTSATRTSTSATTTSSTETATTTTTTTTTGTSTTGTTTTGTTTTTATTTSATDTSTSATATSSTETATTTTATTTTATTTTHTTTTATSSSTTASSTTMTSTWTSSSSTVSSTSATSSTTLSSTTESSSTVSTTSGTSTSATTSTGTSTTSLTSTTETSSTETSTLSATSSSVTLTSVSRTGSTMTGIDGPLQVELSFEGVDHVALTANSSLEEAFTEAVKQVLVSEAGGGVAASDIDAQLFAGSVVVQAVITVPSGASPSAVHSRLSTSGSLPAALAAAVAVVPGIDRAVVGEIVCAVAVGVVDITQVGYAASGSTEAGSESLVLLIVGASACCLVVATCGTCAVRALIGKRRQPRASPLQSVPAVEHTKDHDVDMTNVKSGVGSIEPFLEDTMGAPAPTAKASGVTLRLGDDVPGGDPSQVSKDRGSAQPTNGPEANAGPQAGRRHRDWRPKSKRQEAGANAQQGRAVDSARDLERGPAAGRSSTRL